MEVLGDLIKILLPAAAVLYAMYLTVKAFLNKDFDKRLVDIKIKNTEVTLPLRLQAYERMCLFLERISPHNLVVRLNEPAYNAIQFHQKLLSEVREEFNHNVSQQIYMSDQSWAMVRNAMEEVVSVINASGSALPSDARGLDMAKLIFENLLQKNEDPTTKALKFLKNEIRSVF
ncbi:MAG TPA: hypothetical protein VF691_00470 [Cytophagaceae bacterium]|jgi:hypothetical protein